MIVKFGDSHAASARVRLRDTLLISTHERAARFRTIPRNQAQPRQPNATIGTATMCRAQPAADSSQAVSTGPNLTCK